MEIRAGVPASGPRGEIALNPKTRYPMKTPGCCLIERRPAFPRLAWRVFISAHVMCAAIVPSILLAQTEVRPAVVPEAERQFEIALPGRRFVPPAVPPADLAARLKSALGATDVATRNSVHLLVQLKAAPEAADLARLTKQGIILLEPLTRLTWRAAVTAAGAQALAVSKDVRWAELIKPEDKLAPNAQPSAKALAYQERPGGKQAWSVLFHKGTAAAEVRAMATRLGAGVENFDPRAFPVVRVAWLVVPKGAALKIAAEDSVAWIEAAPPPDDPDNVARVQPLSNVDDVQAAPYELDGSGITVGIWESKSTLRDTHVDLAPRVVVEPDQLSVADQESTAREHTANVAGTIAASGVNIPAAEGMAPAAHLISWDSVGDSNEMAVAMGGAEGRIRVSNHSYGQRIGWNAAGDEFVPNRDLFGSYSALSVASDGIARDFGLTICKSAGNENAQQWDGTSPITGVSTPPGPDRLHHGYPDGVLGDTIEPRGCAKNVITVGAMNGSAEILGMSSFGPTDDGRIKPDIMAQGARVFSLGADSDTDTSSFSGTSQATPAVAGIAALLLQDGDARGIRLRPADVKALLIQTARDVAGTGQATPGPDFATGWGIADALAAVNLLRQNGLVQDSLAATGAANARNHTFFVPPGLAELHVTLAWDDPAGAVGAAAALINDLDLRLIAPDGREFTPWTLDPLSPATAAVRNGGNDAVNNVEQVSVLAPASGVWIARVAAVAGRLPQAPQRYALAGALPHSDVVLVMDRSGSMALPSTTAGVSKIEALRNAADELVALLDLSGGHRLGLVQFDETVTPFSPAFDLQALSATGAAAARVAIDGLAPGGFTNIIGGVQAADSQLGSAAPAFPRQTIVLFSDGRHNRPAGSNLGDINAIMQNRVCRFFSIGFGTDIDDAVLSTVAANSGGMHVNEQDLSPLQLQKHFLTIGALAHDLTTLVDPAYQLGAGESVSLPTGISMHDRSLTIAVNWSGTVAKGVTAALISPDGTVVLPLPGISGAQWRKGRTFQLFRVPLPLEHKGKRFPAAGWSLQVRPEGINGSAKETVDFSVFGESRLRLSAACGPARSLKQVALTASLTMDGKTSAKLAARSVEAFLLLPQPSTDDGEKQDARSPGAVKIAQGPAKRGLTVRLQDDGKDGDLKAGDGIHTFVIDANELPPGLLQARVVAVLQEGKTRLTREANATFYVHQ